MSLHICTRCGDAYAPGHECVKSGKCSVCKGAHRSDLCCAQFKPKAKPKELPKKSDETQSSPKSHSVNKVHTKEGGVALPTAQLNIDRKGQRLTVRGFFDTRSQISFLHPDVLHKLGLKYESSVIDARAGPFCRVANARKSEAPFCSVANPINLHRGS